MNRIVDYDRCGTYFTPFSFSYCYYVLEIYFLQYIMHSVNVTHISGESTEWKSLIVSLASAFVSMFCKEQGITVLVSKSLNIFFSD